jgi:SAM-dependent methyltransferase
MRSQEDRDRIWKEPNAFAKPLKVTVTKDRFEVEGYQNFILEREPFRVIPNDERLKLKMDLLKDEIPKWEGKSFLDLGCNAGFWWFLAKARGVYERLGFDCDRDCVNVARWAAGTWLTLRLDESNNILHHSIDPDTDFIKADIVNAQALIHWLYRPFGSLAEPLRKIASWTKQTLIIEWVGPTDPNILEFGHLGEHHEDYTKERFVYELERLFKTVRCVGDVNPTRSPWVCER